MPRLLRNTTNVAARRELVGTRVSTQLTVSEGQMRRGKTGINLDFYFNDLFYYQSRSTLLVSNFQHNFYTFRFVDGKILLHLIYLGTADVGGSRPYLAYFI